MKYLSQSSKFGVKLFNSEILSWKFVCIFLRLGYFSQNVSEDKRSKCNQTNQNRVVQNTVSALGKKISLSESVKKHFWTWIRLKVIVNVTTVHQTSSKFKISGNFMDLKKSSCQRKKNLLYGNHIIRRIIA